jgi:hypothetical protein
LPVRQPGQEARDRDIGRRVGQRIDRGNQPVGGGIGGPPRRIEVARRLPHRKAARRVGAGDMIVAGGCWRHRMSAAGRAPPAGGTHPATDQS